MQESRLRSRRGFIGSMVAGSALGLGGLGGSQARPTVGQGPLELRRAPLPHTIAAALAAGGAKGMAGTVLPDPPFAYVMLTRLGYGPARRPGQSLAYFNSLGASNSERLSAYLQEQIDGAGDDAELESRINDPAYRTLDKSLTQSWADHEAADGISYYERVRPAIETERVKFLRAVYSRFQLREKLAEFWNDHFNVYSRDNYAEHTMNHWDRVVIRGNMFGNFREMVGATAKHPAMLWYLDNYDNTRSEPNENYARELFELHTVGVENYRGLQRQRDVPLVSLDHENEQGAPFFGGIAEGYVDDDVYEAGACFTGWRVRDDSRNEDIGDTGEFYFDEAEHERTGKAVLSGGVINIDPDGGVSDGEAVLDLVCYHPGTARHIAGKLCRYFIADDIGPDDPIVQDVAAEFYQRRYAANQLRRVIETLVLHPQFMDRASFPGKIRRPFDQVVFAMRAGRADFTIRPDDSESDGLRYRFERTGQYPFRWRPPDGYPHESEFWLNSVALIQSWRVIDWLSWEDVGRDGPQLMPLLEQTLNAFSSDPADHTAEQLVEFWMNRIFGYSPAGGWNGDPIFEQAVAFFTHPYDEGTPPWPRDFPIGTGDQPGIDTNDGPYDWRDRLLAMVGLLLVSPYAMQK